MKKHTASVRSSAGFTVIEVMTTLAIAAILITMGVDSIGTVAQESGVRGAAQSLTALGARTRALSIERGQRARLHLDMIGDSAWIEVGGQNIEVVRFAQQQVDLRSVHNTATICMTPKGYADVDCNSFSGPLFVLLKRGSAHVDMTVLPLGQINGG